MLTLVKFFFDEFTQKPCLCNWAILLLLAAPLICSLIILLDILRCPVLWMIDVHSNSCWNLMNSAVKLNKIMQSPSTCWPSVTRPGARPLPVQPLNYTKIVAFTLLISLDIISCLGLLLLLLVVPRPITHSGLWFLGKTSSRLKKQQKFLAHSALWLKEKQQQTATCLFWPVHFCCGNICAEFWARPPLATTRQPSIKAQLKSCPKKAQQFLPFLSLALSFFFFF